VIPAQISTNLKSLNFLIFKFFNLNKKSSEKQNVKYSPDGADILPQSRRAREIKARAGQNAY
jgi:hypothetical protein